MRSGLLVFTVVASVLCCEAAFAQKRQTYTEDAYLYDIKCNSAQEARFACTRECETQCATEAVLRNCDYSIADSFQATVFLPDEQQGWGWDAKCTCHCTLYGCSRYMDLRSEDGVGYTDRNDEATSRAAAILGLPAFPRAR